MVSSKKFVVGTLIIASVFALLLVLWTWLVTPEEFDFDSPLSVLATLTTILSPVAIVSVMFSLLVQWATHRGSAETLSKQSELHVEQAELVRTATAAYADQLKAMASHIETLRKQANASTAQAEVIQKQSKKTSELIDALETAAKDQKAQNLILVEGMELEKARIKEENFVDELIANALRCSIQRSGMQKNRGVQDLIQDRELLMEAKTWGSFSVTSSIYSALEDFESELTRAPAGKDYEDQWSYATAKSCEKIVIHLKNTIEGFRQYVQGSGIELVQSRATNLMLDGLYNKMESVRSELDKISRLGQSKADRS